MRVRIAVSALALSLFSLAAQNQPSAPAEPMQGFRDPGAQRQIEQQFLAVPDPKMAEQHLKTLTSEPHLAGTPGGRKMAEYVAAQFRAAGLETEILEYRVWMNYPKEISVDVVAPAGVKMHAPAREHVEGDPFQDHPNVVMPFNGFSPSGEVEAEVIYANYGRPEDLDKLAEMKIDVRGKILLVRYGENFRGVKSFVAQERGAAGVLIYSDPIDDGYFKGDIYPKGPWRPWDAVQRGSVLYMFMYPGDPTTPGKASVADLAAKERIAPEQAANLPRIPTTPLSPNQASPLLRNLGGPESPREWQGALPFTYHVGPGPVRVRMKLVQEYAYRPIWNVIGKVRGTELPDEWVVAGNHRDPWVFGAVDPNSGTAAQLEAARGVGVLLKSGWRPRRTLVFASWDAEEQGLIGSTEWVEQHAAALGDAVAYLNIDSGVAGPDFGASAVPSLKQFVRDLTKAVPSPKGGTVYDVWLAARKQEERDTPPALMGEEPRQPEAKATADVVVGDLGSGSDYTPFLQHLGVPATDVSSGGPYGVYHSAFDNFAWYKKFADPEFLYQQQMARVFGLEMLRLAQADVLPFDYQEYGKEITAFIQDAKKKARKTFGDDAPSFDAALEAARRFTEAGNTLNTHRAQMPRDASALNRVLRQAERGLLIAGGLPRRPWFRHAIFAPGIYTGYAAVVIPGVNEAIDAKDKERTAAQISALAQAVTRAAALMESYRPAAAASGR
jgi:N-acetylated-alpha-linked acidic dipeptidase